LASSSFASSSSSSSLSEDGRLPSEIVSQLLSGSCSCSTLGTGDGLLTTGSGLGSYYFIYVFN